jgi:hypothetical protein
MEQEEIQDFAKVIRRILKYYEKYRKNMTKTQHDSFLDFYESVELLMHANNMYPFEYVSSEIAYTHFFLMCELGRWDGSVKKQK